MYNNHNILYNDNNISEVPSCETMGIQRGVLILVGVALLQWAVPASSSCKGTDGRPGEAGLAGRDGWPGIRGDKGQSGKILPVNHTDTSPHMDWIIGRDL